MSENSMAAAAIYNDIAARPGFYNEQWGFNPLNYLRQTNDEEGRAELSLDVKFRKHWFRLVYPSGKITAQPVDVNERFAIFKARVYADRNDPVDNFLAEGTAIRYNGDENAKAFERYFVDWAETIAVGRALTNAGFDVPWCNLPGTSLDLATGELKNEAGMPAAAPRTYSAVTAPPDEEPGEAATSTAQSGAPPAMQGQTPAQAQTPVAPPPAQQAQTPAAQKPTAPLPAQKPRSLEEALSVMNVELAKAQVVTFGQNNGKTLGQIAVDNPKDLDWLANKYKGDNHMLKAGAQILTDAALGKAS